MRVLITGGTGFVGYHSADALLAAGHEVTLLIRSVDKMRALYGDRISDYHLGDVTDRQAVERALDNCDAVIHSAAMVSVNARDAEQLYNTNVQGTKHVVGAAAERGLRIIHVSSVTAMYHRDADGIDEDSALAVHRDAYGRSKVDSDKFVRALQDRGAHITITYPAAILGPQAPALTEPHEGLVTYLSNIVPVMPGGTQVIDVRDIAAIHRQLLEKEHAPDRYILGGHYTLWKDLIMLTERVTGRKKLLLPLPAGLMFALGFVFDLLRKIIDVPIPLSKEGAIYATQWVLVDSGKLQRELDFTFRDHKDTVTDTIKWLADAGHVTHSAIGLLGQAPEPVGTTTGS